MAEKDDDLRLQRIKIGNQDFWAQQKELADDLSRTEKKSSKEKQLKKFEERRLALVADTAYLGFFIFFILWTFFDNPFVPISYSLGALMGLAYAYGLGKYVETLGGSADDVSSIQGAGVGEARFAFLILLFVFVGKFRSEGLLEIPAISGFFTYQLATLKQGLREIND
jgi:hypothetical protein